MLPQTLSPTTRTYLSGEGERALLMAVSCVEEQLTSDQILSFGMRIPKEATLIELAVCFETAFEAAIRRKTENYQELQEEAQNRGYRAVIMTVEVGSRGVVSVQGFKALFDVLTPVTKRDFRIFLITLARTTILESHKIWCMRNNSNQSVCLFFVVV